MWFQTCSWGGMLEKEQVEKCLCLVSCALVLSGSSKSCWAQLGFKELWLHLLHRKIVVRKKGWEAAEWALQREETGIMPFPGLFPLSLRQTGSGSDPWLLGVGSSSGTAGTATAQPRPEESLLAQLDEQGAPHRLCLARGHSKSCIANLV